MLMRLATYSGPQYCVLQNKDVHTVERLLHKNRTFYWRLL